MDHYSVEHDGVRGVFPAKGEPVVVQVGKDLFTPTGGPLKGLGDLEEFCTRLGIKPKASKPNADQKEFLAKFRDKHFPGSKKTEEPKAKPAMAKPAMAKPVKKGLSPEEKLEKAVLEELGRKYDARTSSERGGKKKLVFQLKDKHGKVAEAVYIGSGKFDPLKTLETGVGVLARNRWAAREFYDLFAYTQMEIEEKAEKA